LEERTDPNQIPQRNTPEVVDLVGSENRSDKHNAYGDSSLMAAGGTSSIPRGQYHKHLSVPTSSACDINNSSLIQNSDESNKHVLVAVENLCSQVEMLRKSMVLMEKRLTLIEDKMDIVSSEHQ
jgi:hypothetical protein